MIRNTCKLLSFLCASMLLGCSSGNETAAKQEKISKVVFGSMSLPKATDKTELFSPVYVFSLGNSAKKIFSDYKDSGETSLKNGFLHLSPYIKGEQLLSPYFQSFRYSFNNEGALTTVVGKVVNYDSPKKFREKLSEFCDADEKTMSIEKAGEGSLTYVHGEVLGKYAKCVFDSTDDMASVEVQIQYRKGGESATN